ncbi:MAG TPA: SNF2-related protein, partial [Prolixibacteraceae bacterium]
MEQKFIVTVSEHRLFGFLILPYLAEDGPEGKYLSISQRLRVHDLAEGNFRFSAVQSQLIKLTEKYADENLAKKYNKKGTLNDFYKNVKAEDFNKKIVPFVEDIMVRCLDLLKTAGIPVYFKRAKYNNLYEDDLIELCFEDTGAVFNFHRFEDETRYFLTIRNGADQLSLLHRSIILLVNEPCRILYQNKLYFFDDISGSKLQPFFDKEYISIPRKVEEKYYGTFILNAVKNQEINYSGFEIIDTPVRKEAILSVATDIAGFPVFIPVFKYNDQVIPVTDEGKKVAVFDANNGDYVFYRFDKDLDWESSVISKLRELELQGEAHALHLAGSTEDKNNALYEAIGWLSKNGSNLEEIGLKISQEGLDQNYFTGQQSLNLKINQTSDWFDVLATVTFGQFSFPFIRLRKNIMNNIREFKLPDGEVAILPLEWFAKYQNIFSFGKVGDQSLRLQNHHFTLIAEIAEEMDDAVKDKINSLKFTNLESQNVPPDLNAALRNYQYDGYNWMYHLYANGLGGCLADDMGLGKTIQALTLLLKLKKNEQQSAVFQHKKSGQLSLFVSDENEAELVQPATLIVLPVSLVHNWEKEIRKFAPALRVFVYSGVRR